MGGSGWPWIGTTFDDFSYSCIACFLAPTEAGNCDHRPIFITCRLARTVEDCASYTTHVLDFETKEMDNARRHI